MRRVLVIANKSGWLANRLFVHGHAAAFAARHGFLVLNPSLEEYADYFEGTAHDSWCRFPPLRSTGRTPRRQIRRWLYRTVSLSAKLVRRGHLSNRWVRSEWMADNGVSCDELADRIGRSRITLLEGGGLCAHESWPSVAQAIRSYFRPKRRWRKECVALVARARREGRVVVGVHVRQGLAWHVRFDGRYSWTPSQYASLMRRATGLLDTGATFLVCSNGPLDREAFAGLECSFGGSDPVVDLYALAGCDFLIGAAPSTFLMWAAFWGSVPLYRVEDPVASFSREDFRRVKESEFFPQPMPPDWVPSHGYREFARRWGSRGPDQLWRR